MGSTGPPDDLDRMELFDRLLELEGIEAQDDEIPPADRSPDYPLSFAQEQQWLLHQLDPDASAHVAPHSLTLSGPLDLSALERGLTALIRRHVPLRTVFIEQQGSPRQVILPPAPAALRLVDLGEVPTAPKNREVHRLIDTFVMSPADLTRGPLFRWSLVRTAPDEHVFAFSLHHIIADAWSMALINQELWQLYEGFRTGRQSSLSSLSIQYTDFAVWQRETLTDDVLAPKIDRWRKKLAGAPRLDLPGDRRRPARPVGNTRIVRLLLSQQLTAQIRRLSARENTPLMLSLLAAFKILLGRYAHQTDVVVGATVANRDRVETEGIVGYLANRLPLRSDLSGSPTFIDMLQRVRATFSEAMETEVPFEKLAEAIYQDRVVPLFDVAFNGVPLPGRGAGELEELSRRPFLLQHAPPGLDLLLTVNDQEENLRFLFDYSTDLFDEGTIRRMTGHFQALLEGIIADPARPISDLPPSVENERHRLLEKRDRASGARVGHEAPGVRVAYVAPRNPTEEEVANIFAKVLKVDRVGIHDSFFEMGGHSLLAMQVIARLRKDSQIGIPLRLLFESPTVEKVAAAMTETSPDEVEEAGGAIKRADRSTPLPLSFAQERLWFLDQMEGGSAYNLPLSQRLTGKLDREALHRALNEIVRRHEILRTTLEEDNGIPRQVVHSPAPVPFPLADLAGLPVEAREAEARRLTAGAVRQRLDLARGPVIKIMMLRLEPLAHLLTVTVHHVATDGWSTGLLKMELSSLYKAFVADRSSPLSEPPVQYADYSVWQRGWLSGPNLESQASYWRQQLEGVSTLDLPIDRPRPPVRAERGASVTASLSGMVVRRLRELGQREGATLFMTLLTAFKVLLSRYSGQRDINVGSPIAGRARAEIEDLIGFFVNTLVLRTDLSGNPSFVELLRRVREVCLGAYAHQDLPFEKLVVELQPVRDLSRPPLFQVLFNMFNVSRAAADLEALKIEPFRTGGVSSKFDLELYIGEDSEELRLDLIYNADLFDEETIERMVEHYLNVLAGIVADPHRQISELPLLSEEERRQILSGWNDTAAVYPRTLTLHSLFEDQAKRTPASVAVMFRDEELTYRDLNGRSNMLAHHLRELGVGPDVVVGVCMDRSSSLMVALLGVLKAGGAYLPLDPEFPRERIAYMLDDSTAPLLVTEQGCDVDVEELACQRLDLDVSWTEISRGSDGDPGSAAGSENLAYVIYTSGSTGRPKGVPIRHRALVNFRDSICSEPGLSASDVLVAVTTVSFDISVLELFLPLSVGARVVLASREQAADGQELSALLTRTAATVMQATPATWWILQAAGWTGRSEFKVLCGGEAMPAELARVLLSWSDNVWNLYGPTETTIWSATHRVSRRDEAEGTVLIGGPLNNTSIYILDGELQPVPVGVRGELFIGGDGLARGYWGRPGLTAERFVPDPHSEAPGARMYCTGDLARFRQDGTIEFLGRADFQVKVRGFRIELGEIEARLGERPDVGQAVVLVREDLPGDVRLVAYVVPRSEVPPDAESLRATLREGLPDYMVPSAFVTVDELPLTPNQKVDRKALPAPDWVELGTVDFIAPRDPTEEALTGIWAEVLRVKRVGVRDNFFELGGHSLVAIQVISRIRQKLEVEVPLRELFEMPTVEGLAERIRLKTVGAQDDRIQPVDRSAPLQLSFTQEWLWFVDQLEGSAAYHLTQKRWLRGSLDVGALKRAFEEILRRHEVLRTTLEEQDGAPTQVVHPPGSVPWMLEDLERLPAEARVNEARRLAAEETSQPFDLARGPVIRFMLVRLEPREHLLVVTLHHIAGDGWSIGVLTGELTSHYNACVAGRPPPLPDLPVQYADYAAWQRQRLAGEKLEHRVAYWRERLDGTKLLELPLDRPRPPMMSHRGAALRIELPRPLVDRLEVLGREEGATLFMTLLAAFKLVLSRHADQEDVAVGSPVTDRPRQELEGLIGFFINPVVLRTDLSGDPSFRTLLERVREVSLGTFANADLPFDKLVAELCVERDLSRTPVFQVLFAFQNFLGSRYSLQGIDVEPMTGRAEVAQQDIEVYAWPASDALHLLVWFAVDLFERSTIERMFSHYRTVLEQVAEDPDRKLSALRLTTDEEEELLLRWSGVGLEDEPSEPFLQLFAARVMSTPEAAAVLASGRTLTYMELSRAAGKLAGALLASGGPGTAIGICLGPSADLVVGVLAAMYSGMPFALLDPTLDEDELGVRIEVGGLELILTDDGEVEALARGRGIPTIRMDSAGEMVDLDRCESLPGQVAWIVFTAGNDTPRRVEVPHGVVASQLRAMQESRLTPSPTDLSVLSAADTCHLVWSLLGPLVHGAQVVVADSDGGIGEVKRRVTWRCVSPYRLQELLASCEDTGELQRLRTIIVTGEALAPGLARRCRAQVPAAALYHAYSLAEAGIVALGAVQEVGDAIRIPVGHRVPGARVHVLDQRLAVSPTGIVGQIYIGDGGLFHVQTGAPGPDGSRVSDPHGERGGHLLRTGDQGRFLEDGRLEVWGPRCRRVRVRGFEVDLDYLEGCVTEVEGVAHAAVMEEEGLVAHVVPADDERPPDEGTLREALAGQVPGYMLPERVELHEALPLTSAGKIDRGSISEQVPAWKIVVSATFTAEPLEEPLEYLLHRVGARGEVVFAPYNQVFQQLLDPLSESGRNTLGANVVLIRPEDWLRYIDEEDGAAALLERSKTELIEALTQAAARASVPYIVMVCPAAADQPGETGPSLLEQLEGPSGVHVVTSEEIEEYYPVPEKFDPDSEEMGHVPYTPEYFMALASMLMRKAYAMMNASKKVVVLDCDNTLWTGVVGEDGTLGVQIDPIRAAMQRFLVSQQERGRVLCLCSKNAEEDVLDVFDRHPDMVLKREHLVSWRINWKDKSANIQELAAEIGVGLDSFIFVDDNPVECAEVEAACPEVEVVLLPTDVEEIPEYLNHVWSFDVLKTTAEDNERTRMYQQQIQRDQALQTQSLEEFFARLELEIEIDEMAAADLPRVSQLTLRTNQFNLTTIRRKEPELLQLLSAGHECFVVRVSDRFGDYGLVGVAIYHEDEARLEADTFLLSCRVLNRGVEQAMVVRLGEIARGRGLAVIKLAYQETDRNQPGRNFLDSLVERGGEDAGDGLILSTAEATTTVNVRREVDARGDVPGKQGNRRGARARKKTRASSAFGNLRQLLEEIESGHQSTRRSSTGIVAPRSETEKAVASIFVELLRVDLVGIHDGFFEMGGHSLLAVQVVSRLRKAFKVSVSLRELFSGPTIAELAAAVDKIRADPRAEYCAKEIGRADRDRPLPASHAQQGFWFMERLVSVTSWQLMRVIQLAGELDLASFRWAFARMIERHEILRTSYEHRGHDLVQVIHDAVDEPGLVDLGGLPASLAVKEQERIFSLLQNRPFDLERPPLRAVVLRETSRRHLFGVVVHHIASDDWSMGIFEHELLTLYMASVDGVESRLPDLPFQYADYASWQQSWLRDEELDRYVNFWRQQLDGARSLRLPADRRRRAIPTCLTGGVAIEVSARVTADLLALGQRAGATLFMTLLAAHNALLARYTGQTDICVTSNVAGRDREELERLIGPFANLLIMRTDLSGDPTFLDLLARVKDVCARAWDHQALPSGMLWDQFSPEPDSEMATILRNQTVLALQNAPETKMGRALVGARASRWKPRKSGSGDMTELRRNNDLQLFLIPDEDHLRGTLLYSMDLFDRATGEWMAEDFNHLLEAVVEDADRPISELLLNSPVIKRAAEMLRIEEEKADTGREPTESRLKDKRSNLKQLLAKRVKQET